MGFIVIGELTNKSETDENIEKTGRNLEDIDPEWKMEDDEEIETLEDDEEIETLEEEIQEQKELSEQFLEKIPLERRDAIREAYENSDKSLLEFIESNKEALGVKYSKFNEGSYYYNNDIYMEKQFENDEYGEVFRHELGHYLDEMQGWYSENLEYINSVYDDTRKNELTQGGNVEIRDAMLDELFESDVCYDRNISDILSAMSRNNPELIDRYNREGVAYYHHTNSYFERGHNRENEIYADMIACISENNPETIEFLKKYFPNTYEATRRSFEQEDTNEPD